MSERIVSPSEILAYQVLQVGAIATAAGKLLSAMQNHDIFATVDGYQLLDYSNVHDHRAVYTDEVIRVQPL